METLYEKLKKLAESDVLPMHMPGHKRNWLFSDLLPYEMDITEIDGFDNLHAPEGILKDLCDRISRLWGTSASYPLVNGSTCGILAGIRTLTRPGDAILMARGCHQSVYHAVELLGLDARYLPHEIDPDCGLPLSIRPESVDRMLTAHPNIKLTVITSPTYEGVCSDVYAIAQVVHRHGGLLLVDQAHGAHFGLSEYFPESAIREGADLVIASLHKTLPSMTQTAVAHLADTVDPVAFARNLSIFETSSPSYILLASIDRCVTLLEQYGEELFERFTIDLQRFSRTVRQLNHLYIPNYRTPLLPGVFSFDDGKIVLSTRECNLSGFELSEILRKEYRIETEMATADFVLAITSIADDESTLDRFAKALIDIDRTLESRIPSPCESLYLIPERVMTISEALACADRAVPLPDALGEISADFIRAYPPGIPLIVPGERIDGDILARIAALAESGATLLTKKGKFSGDIFIKAEKRD